MRSVGLIADPVCKEHRPGRDHPERPARFEAALEGLRASGLLSRLIEMPSVGVSEADLLAVHAADYLGLAQEEIFLGLPMLSTGDTCLSEGSWRAALAAAGSAVAAVDAVMNEGVASAFGVVRPPGHHATGNSGMGFCLLNNVAIAARRAQNRFGVQRMLIADWDVHHGNGTQDIFYSDPSVFFFSTHQAPLYPGTGGSAERGAGAGAGSTLNWPFPAGAGRSEILGAFTSSLVPAMEEFRPELVLLSAGFDSRIGDPLGGFRLSDRDYFDLTKVMQGIADRHAEGRLVSLLEGGYNLSGLGSAVAAHVQALLD